MGDNEKSRNGLRLSWVEALFLVVLVGVITSVGWFFFAPDRGGDSDTFDPDNPRLSKTSRRGFSASTASGLDHLPDSPEGVLQKNGTLMDPEEESYITNGGFIGSEPMPYDPSMSDSLAEDLANAVSGGKFERVNKENASDKLDTEAIKKAGKKSKKKKDKRKNGEDADPVTNANAMDSFGAALAEPRIDSKQAEEAVALMSAEDVAEAVAMVEGMEWNYDTHKLLGSLMKRWGELDVGAALEHADGYANYRLRNDALRNAMNSWAKQDPNNAYDWLNEVGFDNEAARYLDVRSIFSAMAAEDFTAAYDKIWELPNAYTKKNAIRGALGRVSPADRQAQLMEWYNTAGTAEDQSMLAQTIVENWRIFQPEQAAQWIEGVNDPQVRYQATRSLIQTWGKDDPRNAIEWVWSGPNYRARPYDVGKMVKTWTQRDSEEVEDWLYDYQPSPSLDPVVDQYIKGVMVKDPQNAMSWTESITNPKKRLQNMYTVGRVWLKQDPAAATAYIAASELPEKTKEKLLNPPPVKQQVKPVR